MQFLFQQKDTQKQIFNIKLMIFNQHAFFFSEQKHRQTKIIYFNKSEKKHKIDQWINQSIGY